ncbi:hypothetical protein ACH5RR_014747 [Cinchona calisaya]|uniref:Uncharacterized protein n=1 Tax=Cinchona calisaya TaxID=153742 RepID=A0ABD2ZWF6_9GENT
MMEAAEKPPRVLSPCTSGKRRSFDKSQNSSSPEFEFWNMLKNPSNFPQQNLLSADQLFSDGVLLPLHLLHNTTHNSDDDDHPPENPNDTEEITSVSDHQQQQPGSGPGPGISSSVLSGLSAPAPTFTSSKRWKDIFKINSDPKNKEKDKEKIKKEKKINNGVSAAELNINIWPFSRSRSAGNGATRPRMPAGATRKVSSAPCSRSNSAGESKSKKQWPSSPSRGGVHLGRSSPVWQVRRGAGGGKGGGAGDLVARNAENGIIKRDQLTEVRRKTSASTVSGGGAATAGGGAKAKVLNLNIPMCIGSRHHLSCRSDENSAVSVVLEAAVVGGGGGGVGGVHGGGGSGSDEGVRGSNLFNIRSLFTKKVH